MQKHTDTFLKQFGERVRLLRQRRKLSQEELADRAGIDRTYIGGVERGERNIGLLNIKKLADALSINPKDLFDENQL